MTEDLELWQWNHDAEKRERGLAVVDRPEPGSRWRNRHCGDLVSVRLVMDRSPGGGLMYPIVEFVPDDYQRPWFADHEPWWALDEWHSDWKEVEV
jgi:hypothetical protein